MKLRDLSLIGLLTVAVFPAPAQAQGDFIKDNLRELIEKSGIYVSGSTRTAADDEVDMGPSLGIGYGTAGEKRTGVKFPFSFSGYSGNLQTSSDGEPFGRFKAKLLLAGVGYQWVFGKMVYSAQVKGGYAFNRVTIGANAPAVFSAEPPISVDVGNSFVVRPQVKAEYFVHHKLSVRTQLSYTYSDPKVVVTTANSQFADQWHPHHLQFSVAMGVFPFRKK